MTWDTIANDHHNPNNPVALLANRAHARGLINHGLLNYICDPLYAVELLQEYETTTDHKRKVRIARLLGTLNKMHRKDEPIFVCDELLNPHG